MRLAHQLFIAIATRIQLGRSVQPDIDEIARQILGLWPPRGIRADQDSLMGAQQCNEPLIQKAVMPDLECVRMAPSWSLLVTARP